VTASSAVLVLAIASCGPSTSNPSELSNRGSSAHDAGDWSESVGGLRIRLELPASVKLAGTEAVTATLHVRNESPRPIRILLVRPEVFRLFTSSLRVWRDDKVISLQPEPHPHGYLLAEEDFVVIAPHDTLAYKQTLYLTPELAKPGTYEVEWMLENATRRWPGGAQTLDGVTKPLFGGTDVPDLWVGKLAVRRRLTLE
jgi:hypothetical protein